MATPKRNGSKRDESPKDEPPLDEKDAGGGRMYHWLAKVMAKERENAGLTTTQIAARAGVTAPTIERFEAATHASKHVDSFVAAYADLLGVDDPLVFYERALANWRKEGEPPTLEAETTTQRVQAGVERATRRKQQARGAQSETPDATPKKREAG